MTLHDTYIVLCFQLPSTPEPGAKGDGAGGHACSRAGCFDKTHISIRMLLDALRWSCIPSNTGFEQNFQHSMP